MIDKITDIVLLVALVVACVAFGVCVTHLFARTARFGV